MDLNSAIRAYKSAQNMPINKGSESDVTAAAASSSFKQFIGQTASGLHAAEISAEGFIAKKVSATDLVTAVSQADTQLQTLVSVRDRFVSAIQEIMRMSI